MSWAKFLYLVYSLEVATMLRIVYVIVKYVILAVCNLIKPTDPPLDKDLRIASHTMHLAKPIV